MTCRSLFSCPVQRRLAPLTAASFFGAVALWVPIEKLFLADIGFTPQTVGLMAAAYAAVVPLLEIPSGILADRWSRRGVLLLGNGGMVLSVLVGGLSTNVTTYVVAAMLLGVYFAGQSGTLESIVYDTVLEETGGSGQFESIVGRVRMVESAALVLGALGGGVLAAATSPRLTYFATLPFVVVSTACLVAFREPRLHQTGKARSLRQQVGLTLGVLRHNRQVRPIAALLVLSSILAQTVYEFGPLWLVDSGASAGSFGPAWAGLMASIGIGGALAGRVRLDRLAAQGASVALLVGGAGILLVSRHTVVVTAAQIVVAVVAVVIGIHFTRRLHDAVASDVRSGVASGVGAVTWATFLPLALGFGAVSERWGIHAAGWLIVAVAVGIGSLLVRSRPSAPAEASEASDDVAAAAPVAA